MIVDKKLGSPYKLGESGPDLFDCLGWAVWCLNEAVGAGLEYPRTVDEWRAFHTRWFVWPFDWRVEAGDLLWVGGDDRRLKDQHICVVESRSWCSEASSRVGVHRELISDVVDVGLPVSIGRLRS